MFSCLFGVLSRDENVWHCLISDIWLQRGTTGRSILAQKHDISRLVFSHFTAGLVVVSSPLPLTKCPSRPHTPPNISHSNKQTTHGNFAEINGPSSPPPPPSHTVSKRVHVTKPLRTFVLCNHPSPHGGTYQVEYGRKMGPEMGVEGPSPSLVPSFCATNVPSMAPA